ncbi:hypothetical protein SAY87_012363 [Trapa incisa]|uniref:Uncharacterized protein n=2 Tax=Trapa TaxID=22665 RepID=A0AAN7R890_TRANT|nr:hypothetical protein SAY87_012363 [Trapa incisa]KAK4795634.1 hypothetical protein SAY86_027960 [Trapa natans]
MEGKHVMDTALTLNSPGSEYSQLLAPRGVKRKWNLVNGSIGQQVDRQVHRNESTPYTKRVVSSSMRSLELRSIDLELGLSSGATEPGITSIHKNMLPFTINGIQNAEEGMNHSCQQRC